MMSRYRYFLPLSGFVGLCVVLGVALVEVMRAVVPAESPGSVRFGLVLIGAVVAAAVAIAGMHRLVVAPLHAALHVIYRMSEGDFSKRTVTNGSLGVTAEIADALDDLAGLLEARWEAARASEHRYRHLFEASPVGLFRTRPDGRVLDCNPAAVALLGYASVVDVTTRNARTFYADPGDRDRLVERLARGEVLRNIEVRLRRKDGRAITALLTATRTEEAGESCIEGQLIDVDGLALAGYAGREGGASPHWPR